MTALHADQPLVLSSYCLGTEVPFAQRVSIAADAGFAGIGLRAENYWDAQQAGLDDQGMQDILDGHRVAIREVEYLTDWGTEEDRTDAQRRKEDTIFHLARTFGVSHVNAGLFQHPAEDAIVAGFADLCQRAGELTVALEFLPFGGVPNLGSAWNVIHSAGQPNGALLIDFWHWRRSGTSLADLAPVPADKIVSVQIDDVREHPMDPLRPEALHWRLPPGRGFGNVTEIIDALRAKQVQPRIVAVEVMNDDLIASGLDTTAHTLMQAARDVLAR
jgi:sugar phosphate isomerase/epimerase